MHIVRSVLLKTLLETYWRGVMGRGEDGDRGRGEDGDAGRGEDGDMGRLARGLALPQP